MRKSKYEMMINQVVKMSFADVKVTGYRNPKVTSKTGREYRKYEVEVDNVLWVSTTSFTKQSFSRRYFKALENVEVVQEEQPVNKETLVDDWYNDWKLKREIDDLHEASLVGKDMANQYFERISKSIKESNNMNVYGQTIWHTKEELFELWNNHVITIESERIKEELDNGNYEQGFFYVWSYGIATLNEWQTEYEQKLWQFIQDEWSNLEERRCKAQKDWRDRMYGSDWQDRWQRRNFGNTINYEVNEYDEKFKDCKTVKDVKRVYRSLAKMTHSDTGGSDEEFIKVKGAYDRALSLVA